jgi:predicted enzyme related to lactoylglutathione lyase
MGVPYKVVMDCADPHKLAVFWSEALGFVIEDNSELIRKLLDNGTVGPSDVVEVAGRLAWRTAAAIRDPNAAVNLETGVGQGGRVLFQTVPEPKVAKNRIHLDLHVGEAERGEKVARLTSLGGQVLYYGEEGPASWVTMIDPEGNEFCVS